MRTGWSVPLEALAARAQQRLEVVARKIMFEAFTAVVRRSPVDTGRFRANWNIGIGHPDYSTSDTADQTRGDSSAAEALKVPLGNVIYFTNGLPYAARLEHGYSQQAPQGMVKLTVAELEQHIQQALGR